MNLAGRIIFLVFMAAYIIFWGAMVYIGIPREQRKKQKKHFDERQKVAQYRACQYAYFTLIIYLALYVILNQVFDFIRQQCDFATQNHRTPEDGCPYAAV